MKQSILTAFLILGFITSLSGNTTTVCNGNWSDPEIWESGRLPGANEVITIKHRVVLDQNFFEMQQNELVVEEFGELYINYEFTIPSGSSIESRGSIIGIQFNFYGSFKGNISTVSDYQDFFSLPNCTPHIIMLDSITLRSNIEAESYEWYKDGALMSDSTQTIHNLDQGEYINRIRKNIGSEFGAFSSPVIVKFTEVVEQPEEPVADEESSVVFKGLKDEIFIQPNPCRDYITIDMSDLPSVAGNIFIYNTSGQFVMSFNLSSVINDRLNVSALEKGVYYARVQLNDRFGVVKLVKL